MENSSLLTSFLGLSLFFCALTIRAHDLVDIEKINSHILLDIKYATTDNFTKQKVYSQPKAYLRKEVAERLDKVQKDLEKQGLGLKIWDAYRPRSVQYTFWKLVPDERYVANPAKGSRHNRGAAVDITLVNASGKELPMPTEFDNFTEKAHRDYMQLPAEVLKNREILEQAMTAHGFEGLSTEWWHFDYKNWQQYDLLDIPFEELSAPSSGNNTKFYIECAIATAFCTLAFWQFYKACSNYMKIKSGL